MYINCILFSSLYVNNLYGCLKSLDRSSVKVIRNQPYYKRSKKNVSADSTNTLSVYKEFGKYRNVDKLCDRTSNFNKVYTIMHNNNGEDRPYKTALHVIDLYDTFIVNFPTVYSVRVYFFVQMISRFFCPHAGFLEK